MFEIRDPIHRTISFSESEKRVIDHPYVQRLRHVRQLGLSYLVYPGATHDRFSHALGAMHVAGRLWDGIVSTSGDVLRKRFSEEDLARFRRLLRLSGLLHDLGHPPFSHVSEQFMPSFSELEIPIGWFEHPDQDRQAKHEDYSVVLIAALAKGPDAALSEDEARDIASLVHHGVTPGAGWEGREGIRRLLRSLISGELDCDRMDYLLRDAYHTGAAYGAHDIDHLVGNLGVVDHDEMGLRLTIDATAVRTFEDFLLARYHMFIQVYMHKTTTAFDHYLDQALQHGEFSLVVPGTAEEYAELRDSTLIERLFGAAKDPANVWARRLTERRPPKLLLQSANAIAEDRTLMEQTVAMLMEAAVPYFTMDARQTLSKMLGATAPPDPEGTAMLVRKKVFGAAVYEPIERHSSLLNKYNEVIDLTNLYVLPEHVAAAMKAIEPLRPRT